LVRGTQFYKLSRLQCCDVSSKVLIVQYGGALGGQEASSPDVLCSILA
jgi:hypothetical protein